MLLNKEVGVLSCSGEECLGGAMARLATRKVMGKYPNQIVTLCLPLYVAGGQEEREFAKEYPVLTVEGCAECCARKATLKYSGEVKDTLIISDIVGNEVALSKNISLRKLTNDHYKMIDNIANEIEKKVNFILAE